MQRTVFPGRGQPQKVSPFAAVAPPKLRPPPRVETLPVAAFADDWPDKPKAPVEVGIRLLSESDLQAARAEAAKRAWMLFPDESRHEEERIEAHNDALMAHAVARGTCRAEDVTRPWLDAAEDNVPLALTSAGVRRLWEALERLAIEESVLTPEASAEELQALAWAITAGTLGAALPPAKARHLRRLLRHAVETAGLLGAPAA